MTITYSIIDIETAINFWRVSEPAPSAYGLCRQVRVLADIYGRMISMGANQTHPGELTDEQNKAITDARERLNALHASASDTSKSKTDA